LNSGGKGEKYHVSMMYLAQLDAADVLHLRELLVLPQTRGIEVLVPLHQNSKQPGGERQGATRPALLPAEGLH